MILTWLDAADIITLFYIVLESVRDGEIYSEDYLSTLLVLTLLALGDRASRLLEVHSLYMRPMDRLPPYIQHLGRHLPYPRWRHLPVWEGALVASTTTLPVLY